MNYYEHHIRDYDAATSHLTWDEDLAYTRLIRWYYRKEKAIPADVKEACRQVRATSKTQRDAVESVLREFFVLCDDGWHNETCDEVIARFKDGEPEREVKKANEENRLKRHRDERARLFKVLTDAGEHAPWNIKMEDLREMVARVSAPKLDTKPATTATAHATPATATQSPIPNHQSPDIKPIASSSDLTGGSSGEEPSAAVRFAVSIRGWEKARGKMAAVQAQDPRLQAWADAGITDDQLALAYEWAVSDREASGDASPVNAGFLDVFVAKVLKPLTGESAVAKLPPKRPWFMSSSGIEEKAVELGIAKRSGEQFSEFRARVYTAGGVTEEMYRKAKIDAGERV